MAADANLINTFRGAFRTPMADITPVLQGIEKVREKAEERGRLKRIENERIKAVAAKYKDRFPSDASMAGLPVGYKNTYEPWLEGRRDQYMEDSNIIGTLDPTSEEYDVVKRRMQNTLDSFKNLKGQFDKLGAEKLVYNKNVKKNKYNDVNSSYDNNLNSFLYSDQLKLRIDEGGNIFFSGDGIEEFNYNDRVELFNSDVSDALYTPLQEDFTAAFNMGLKGVTIPEECKNFTKGKLKKIVDNSTSKELAAALITPIFSDTPLDPNLTYDSTEIQNMFSDDPKVAADAKKLLQDKLYNNLEGLYNEMYKKGGVEYLRLSGIESSKNNSEGSLTEREKNTKAIVNRVGLGFSSVDSSRETLKQSEFQIVARELNKQFKGSGVTLRLNISGKTPMIQILDDKGEPYPGMSNYARIPFTPKDVARTLITLLNTKNVDIPDLPGMTEEEMNFVPYDANFGITPKFKTDLEDLKVPFLNMNYSAQQKKE